MPYLATGWKSIWRSAAAARNRRALQSLSDHMLKDIGLSRSDIDSISAHSTGGRSDVSRRRRGQ